jgi:hypothetical protein
MLARYAALAAMPLTIRETQGLVPAAAASPRASEANDAVVAAPSARNIETPRDDVTSRFPATLAERNIGEPAVAGCLHCASA